MQGSGDASPEIFYEYAPKFIVEINRVSAKPVLFLEHPDINNEYPLERILEVNEKVATEYGVDVIPTGLAWARSIKERPDLNLYDTDGGHGNVAGSYLDVCVVYATLFNQSPVGATYLPLPEGSLSADDAAFLQQIAWETVQQYKSQ